VNRDLPQRVIASERSDVSAEALAKAEAIHVATGTLLGVSRNFCIISIDADRFMRGKDGRVPSIDPRDVDHPANERMFMSLRLSCMEG
jgi:hypothetical protein